ncbi:hypothetical protein C8R44DRAFT_751247 [Mycena epipterygia]|nr:hypothetical protein C8R44DRAFT_751247 [Mycena epipterygia]
MAISIPADAARPQRNAHASAAQPVRMGMRCNVANACMHKKPYRGGRIMDHVPSTSSGYSMRSIHTIEVCAGAQILCRSTKRITAPSLPAAAAIQPAQKMRRHKKRKGETNERDSSLGEIRGWKERDAPETSPLIHRDGERASITAFLQGASSSGHKIAKTATEEGEE